MTNRYQRNIDVPGFGEEGQRRLLAASVLVVGAGGLGSAALPYLVAAGVGHVTIADGDVVEEHNLQRQVLHHQIGRNKAESAAERLRPLNPDVTIEPIASMLDAVGVGALMNRHDVVLDCTDSFAAKFMLSDTVAAAGRPLVWASAVGMYGQCSVFGVPDAEGNVLTLRDLIADEPAAYPKATDVGVLGAVVGQIGTLQATETIKLLTGVGTPLVGRVLVLDASGAWPRVLPLRQR